MTEQTSARVSPVAEPKTASAPKVYAHEMVPHLPEYDEAGARWVTRYHVARASGLLLGWYERQRPDPTDRHAVALDMRWLGEALAQAELAFLSYAVLIERPNPHAWVQQRMGADVVGEWLWEIGMLLGLDMDRLRPYDLAPASPESGESRG